MTANVARVVLTGYIMHFVDPQYASGAYHTLEGLLMMGFGLLLLNSLCSLLNQCFPDRRDLTSRRRTIAPSAPAAAPGAGGPDRARRLTGAGSRDEPSALVAHPRSDHDTSSIAACSAPGS